MSETPDFDVAVIGAGFTGMYAVYRLRELGFSVKGIEEASDVGGVWWHNRYPGCRVDIESYFYCYGSRLDRLRKSFDWTERFSSQPDVLRYLYDAADEMDIRKHYLFKTRLKGASWEEEGKFWRMEFQRGGSAPLTARYILSAMGPISASQMPNIPGVHTFAGQSLHTAHWPHPSDAKSTEGASFDFSGKRVAVIGTGSSGVQTIQELAKVAGHLYVFQRSPTWCTPLGNGPLSAQELTQIRSDFPKSDALCDEGMGGVPLFSIPKSILEVPEAEREATLERLYQGPGFRFWIGNYEDILLNKRANDLVTQFAAKKIRQRVKDPKIADLLTPKDHGFGLRRVPLESNYYEVYNQDNVTLVDVRATPIERVVPAGIKTSDQLYELDTIVYAPGFDALRGAFARIDLTGRNGVTLKDTWAKGVRTLFGLQVPAFPNFFTLVGPQNAAGFGNIPRNTVAVLELVMDLLRDTREHNFEVIEATEDATTAYTQQVHALGTTVLFSGTDSWITGVNKNISDRQQRELLLWVGGMPAFLDLIRKSQSEGWQGFNRT